MKFHTIMRFATDRAMDSLFSFLGTVLLCCTVFCLLLFSFFSWQYLRFEYTAEERCLNGNIEQAGMLYIDKYLDTENVQLLLQSIIEMDAVIGVTGCSDVISVDRYTIEEKSGAKNPDMTEADEDTLEWLYMNRQGLEVCHFHLIEGRMPDEWKLGADEHLVYLGCKVKGFEIGSKYYDAVEQTTFVVGGILKQNSTWIYDDVYRFGNPTDSRYVQRLDHCVVELEDSLVNGRNTYLIKSGYQMEDVEQDILKLAKEYDVDITLARLQDVLDDNAAAQTDVLRYIIRITMVIMATLILLLLCVQLSSVLRDFGYFGILYANGASMKDLVAILLCENMFKVICSYAISAFAVYGMLRREWQKLQPGIDNWSEAGSVYLVQTLLPTLVVGVMIIILTTVIPFLWLHRKQPMELV